MSDSVRPHRRKPTRLPGPWDSPGKNTGVGCRFLLQCMKVKSESEVAQSCWTLETPWTAAYQAPPSMGFSRQKSWSGVPLPSPCQCWVFSNVNISSYLITVKYPWLMHFCFADFLLHNFKLWHFSKIRLIFIISCVLIL